MSYTEMDEDEQQAKQLIPIAIVVLIGLLAYGWFFKIAPSLEKKNYKCPGYPVVLEHQNGEYECLQDLPSAMGWYNNTQDACDGWWCPKYPVEFTNNIIVGNVAEFKKYE